MSKHKQQRAQTILIFSECSYAQPCLVTLSRKTELNKDIECYHYAIINIQQDILKNSIASKKPNLN